MGESIRKMALVPMDYHLNQPPVKAQLNELDSEMKNILDSTLPSDAKFKLYNHILHQHGAVSEEMKKPMKVEIKTEQPAVGKFSRVLFLLTTFLLATLVFILVVTPLRPNPRPLCTRRRTRLAAFLTTRPAWLFIAPSMLCPSAMSPAT